KKKKKKGGGGGGGGGGSREKESEKIHIKTLIEGRFTMPKKKNFFLKNDTLLVNRQNLRIETFQKKKKKKKLSRFPFPSLYEEKASGINKKYELRTALGTGSFAVVRLGIDRSTGQHVAVKQIDKKKYQTKSKSKNPDSIKNEFEILRNINHKNIIKVYDVFETDETLYLVLEMASGGDLFQRIVQNKKLSGEFALTIYIYIHIYTYINILYILMWQLLSAIKHLHDGKVAHRDLKPENVLLKANDSWEIKITDFGLSRALKLDQEALTTMCGTPLFLAPEILSSHKTGLVLFFFFCFYYYYYYYSLFFVPLLLLMYSNLCTLRICIGYGFEVDYWSMGVILYLMLVGHVPYNDKDGLLLDLVKAGKFTFPAQTWRYVSPDAKDLVQNLMQVDPTKRFGWEQADPLSIPPPEEFGLECVKEVTQSHDNATPIISSTQLSKELSSGLTVAFDHMEMFAVTANAITTTATNMTLTTNTTTATPNLATPTLATPQINHNSPKKLQNGTATTRPSQDTSPVFPSKLQKNSRKRVLSQRNDFDVFDFQHLGDDQNLSPKCKKPKLQDNFVVCQDCATIKRSYLNKYHRIFIIIKKKIVSIQCPIKLENKQECKHKRCSPMFWFSFCVKESSQNYLSKSKIITNFLLLLYLSYFIITISSFALFFKGCFFLLVNVRFLVLIKAAHFYRFRFTILEETNPLNFLGINLIRLFPKRGFLLFDKNIIITWWQKKLKIYNREKNNQTQSKNAQNKRNFVSINYKS
ncbi:protein kinase 1, partial [Reticulomyxa filosa]